MTLTDEELIAGLKHLQLAWNTPLSEAHAEEMLRELDLCSSRQIVDLGCGWGELLLRAVEHTDRAQGEGIERDPSAIARARAAASIRGLARRVRFTQGDIRTVGGSADRVFSIGSEHAWGGLAPALKALRDRVEPGGRLLLGAGYWKRKPTSKLERMLGELPESLGDLTAMALPQDWTLLSHSEADDQEWDEFETGWNQDLVDLSAQRPDSPLGRQARRLLRQRREEYFRGYRGVLGFAYLILEKR